MIDGTDVLNRPDGQARLLRAALLANAAFSGVTGLLLVIQPGMVIDLLGVGSEWILRLLGLGLALFAVELVFQASRAHMASWRALLASAADLAWVLASILGVLFFGSLLSAAGLITVLVVAGIVLALAIAQLIGIKRFHRSLGSP